MNTRIFITGSENYCTVNNHINAPLFKTVFNCPDLKNSRLEISAVGLYRLFLNGHELTKGILAPYISNPDDIVYYDEYNVDFALKKENNVLCVLLGNGFSNAMDNNLWDFEKASFRSAPKFYLSLSVDGKEIVNTSNGFQVADSPIIFDDIRCGEWFDARLEDDSLISPEFSDKFRNVIYSESPLGEYKKCEAHPVRILGTIKVKRIIKAKDGYIYDFGEVNSGVCKLSVTAKAGQEIDLSFVEMVSCSEPDFSALLFENSYPLEYVQHDKYICKDGYQEYTPSFTYHGFQYCYVKGITNEQATEELLEMKILHSDIPKRGSFRCSDPVINKIQDASMRSAESNFVYFITDCPQREKNGWTSEGHVTAEYVLRFYDCVDSLKEWLNNIRKAQKPDGQLPGIIPTAGWGFEWGNGPQWDKIIVELPYLIYLYTGDTEVIRENIDAIAAWINYLNNKTNENGLISYGLPDWCVAGGFGDEEDLSTPNEVSDTLISIEVLRKAKMLFGLCNVDTYNKLIDNMLDKFIKNFKEKYIKDNLVTCESQTAQALALELGLFEDNKKAFEKLLNIIKRDNYHMHCGVLGYRPFFRALAEYGQIPLAYKMIVQDTHPSYGNIIKQGATGMWEKFTEYYETSDGIRQKDGWNRNYSLNHPVFGGITSFFMEYFAGIRVISHDTVEISPCLIKELSDIEASFENKGRNVTVHIENIENSFKISVKNNGFKCSIKTSHKAVECSDGELTVIYIKSTHNPN